jgi:hypothetical protein
LNKFFVYNNTDTVTKTYTLSNKGIDQTGVVVKFTIPAGLAISRTIPSKGTFSNNSWIVGELVSNEVANLVVIFTVTNINYAPYDVQSQIESVQGGLSCEGHIYIEKSLTPCTDCNKAYPIFPAFSADNGSFTNNTLNFFDSNVSFLTTVSNGSSGVIGFYDPARIYINTEYRDLGDIKFQNSNGISFGVIGSVITASHNALTTQFNQVVSASNSSLNFNTLYFGNTLGLSHYISDGSLFISSAIKSYSVVGNTTAQSSSNTYNNLVFSAAGNLSIGISNNTLVFSASNIGQSSLSFADSNGISFGINGSTLTASHNGLTTQSAQIVSANNGSFAFQTLEFANLNGVTFYTTNGSLAASYTLPSDTAFSVQAPGSTYTNSVQFVNANGVSFSAGVGGISASIATQFVTNVSNSNNVTLGVAGGLLTASVNSQTNQSIGLYALGNTTNNSSGTLDARSFSVIGYGDISVGYSNNSLQISNVPSYDTVFPKKENYNFSFSTNETSIQYGFSERLEHNVSYNAIYLPVNLTVDKTVGTNSANLTWTGLVNLNIYTNTGSTLTLLSSGNYEYDFHCVTRVPGSFGSHSFSYIYNYTQRFGTFSTTNNKTFSTGIVVSNGSHNISNVVTALTGSAMLPIVQNLPSGYFAKGLHYYMVSLQSNNSDFCFNSIGYKTINSKSYLDLMEFGFNNFPLQLNPILKNSLTQGTANSYHLTNVSTASNISYKYPSLIFIKS